MSTLSQSNSVSHLQSNIEVLGLSTRAHNCLNRAGIDQVAELIEMSEQDIAALRNMGPTTLNEVQRNLHKCLESVNGSASLEPLEPNEPRIAYLAQLQSSQHLGSPNSLIARDQLLATQFTSQLDTVDPQRKDVSVLDMLDMSMLEVARFARLTSDDWGKIIGELKLVVPLQRPNHPLSTSASLQHPISHVAQKPIQGLPIRTAHALANAGILDVDSLSDAKLSEIIAIRQVGKIGVVSIIKLLKSVPSPRINTYSNETDRKLPSNEKVLRSRWRIIKPALASEVQTRRLDPKIQFANLSIDMWLQTDGEGQPVHDLAMLCLWCKGHGLLLYRHLQQSLDQSVLLQKLTKCYQQSMIGITQ